MRILIAGPNDGQTFNYIFDECKQLNHEVIMHDVRKEPIRLLEASDSFNPDVIIASRTISMLHDWLHIKRHRKYVKLVCWNVDKRNSVKEFGSLLQLFNEAHLFYTIALGNVEQYRQLCPDTKVGWLQQGCKTQVHSLYTLTSQDHDSYDCDVMFDGHYPSPVHQHRNTLIASLLHSCEKSGLRFKHYSQQHGTAIYDAEYAKACQCSKVCLSTNGWANLPLSMSVRVYKIMGSGGICLEEYCEGINEWLGGWCFTYKSKEECWDWIEKLVKIPEVEREKQRVLISKYTYANHTYKHRVEKILEDVAKL